MDDTAEASAAAMRADLVRVAKERDDANRAHHQAVCLAAENARQRDEADNALAAMSRVLGVTTAERDAATALAAENARGRDEARSALDNERDMNAREMRRAMAQHDAEKQLAADNFELWRAAEAERDQARADLARVTAEVDAALSPPGMGRSESADGGDWYDE